ncbi:unnamed protein product [marine sediment metagenome]|uniref:Uncharacterized protein n=1 Tax=marine sediment metagenome TaxID=412755 RepID=X0V7T7_9ZZZZ
MTAALDDFTSETQLGTDKDAAASILVSTTSTEKKFIGDVEYTNTSVSAIEVTVWRLLTATTATTGSGGNWLAKKTIQPGKVWSCPELRNSTLGISMSVRAIAGTGSVVNANLGGVTES